MKTEHLILLCTGLIVGSIWGGMYVYNKTKNEIAETLAPINETLNNVNLIITKFHIK